MLLSQNKCLVWNCVEKLDSFLGEKEYLCSSHREMKV